ncbi:salivary glue protein Sgs-3-like [Pecten maximus]|uniref:salivary glue protein Sgs-3-like n=1 Tax=Pecten maximus TaxID=6579 RepID=UPI001459036D|nr:salivary glue protein Sgs-3-like [Pecten maximus]
MEVKSVYGRTDEHRTTREQGLGIFVLGGTICSQTATLHETCVNNGKCAEPQCVDPTKLTTTAVPTTKAATTSAPAATTPAPAATTLAAGRKRRAPKTDGADYCKKIQNKNDPCGTNGKCTNATCQQITTPAPTTTVVPAGAGGKTSPTTTIVPTGAGGKTSPTTTPTTTSPKNNTSTTPGQHSGSLKNRLSPIVLVIAIVTKLVIK